MRAEFEFEGRGAPRDAGGDEVLWASLGMSACPTVVDARRRMVMGLTGCSRAPLQRSMRFGVAGSEASLSAPIILLYTPLRLAQIWHTVTRLHV